MKSAINLHVYDRIVTLLFLALTLTLAGCGLSPQHGVIQFRVDYRRDSVNAQIDRIPGPAVELGRVVLAYTFQCCWYSNIARVLGHDMSRSYDS